MWLADLSAMPTNEIADPAVEDAEQRAERAKASLLSRVEALKDKLGEARRKLDLPSQIATHPLPAVGIALALGAAVGLARGRRSLPGEPASSTLSSAMLTGLAALGLRIVREVALGQLTLAARRWASEGEAGPDEAYEPSPGDAPFVAQ